jgi:hypothetical protein
MYSHRTLLLLTGSPLLLLVMVAVMVMLLLPLLLLLRRRPMSVCGVHLGVHVATRLSSSHTSACSAAPLPRSTALVQSSTAIAATATCQQSTHAQARASVPSELSIPPLLSAHMVVALPSVPSPSRALCAALSPSHLKANSVDSVSTIDDHRRCPEQKEERERLR